MSYSYERLSELGKKIYRCCDICMKRFPKTSKRDKICLKCWGKAKKDSIAKRTTLYYKRKAQRGYKNGYAIINALGKLPKSIKNECLKI
jgi:hypothetical protein